MLAVAAIEAGLDCRKCTQDLKDERGCKQDSTIPARWDIDGDEYSRCPMSLLTQQTHDYLQAHTFFSMGMLPNGFGWVHESPKFLQAMMILSREQKRWQAKTNSK
jgi:hypothetical protein